jgi:hypothetical protein
MAKVTVDASPELQQLRDKAQAHQASGKGIEVTGTEGRAPAPAATAAPSGAKVVVSTPNTQVPVRGSGQFADEKLARLSEAADHATSLLTQARTWAAVVEARHQNVAQGLRAAIEVEYPEAAEAAAAIVKAKRDLDEQAEKVWAIGAVVEMREASSREATDKQAERWRTLDLTALRQAVIAYDRRRAETDAWITGVLKSGWEATPQEFRVGVIIGSDDVNLYRQFLEDLFRAHSQLLRWARDYNARDVIISEPRAINFAHWLGWARLEGTVGPGSTTAVVGLTR